MINHIPNGKLASQYLVLKKSFLFKYDYCTHIRFHNFTTWAEWTLFGKVKELRIFNGGVASELSPELINFGLQSLTPILNRLTVNKVQLD